MAYERTVVSLVVFFSLLELAAAAFAVVVEVALALLVVAAVGLEELLVASFALLEAVIVGRVELSPWEPSARSSE